MCQVGPAALTSLRRIHELHRVDNLVESAAEEVVCRPARETSEEDLRRGEQLLVEESRLIPLNHLPPSGTAAGGGSC